MWAGKPSQYVTSHPGQLSLLPTKGQYNEYQLSGAIAVVGKDTSSLQVDQWPKFAGLIQWLATFFIYQINWLKDIPRCC